MQKVSTTVSILKQLNEGSGYVLDSLTAGELGWMRARITDQYLARIRELQPDLCEWAAAAGIANYHTLPIRFDHGKSWLKETRLLPGRFVKDFEQMGFFQRIREQLGESACISHDELNWRLVRPGKPEDVGPVHADKWFWDAGYGYGSMPAGFDRFKIWIAVYTESGLNGLTVKPGSHKVTTWKHHFEVKGGINKPVLDEDEADLDMQLLPMESGELVMFHDQLLHGGYVNRGQRCRLSLELTVLFDLSEGLRRRGGFRARRTVAVAV